MNMDFTKVNWHINNDEVRLQMPLCKVDREHRLVSGFATLDNVDLQNDVMLAEASVRAFERFRGNIREMHQPIAVGKLVDFREDEFYDPQTEKFYRGIYVTVYISTGAQDTWEKVLDGTLTGFSIGGAVIEADSQYVPELKKAVRFVKDYFLTELSLVDNPCNQLANVFSIQKSASGMEMTGMVANTKTVNVFWCSKDRMAKDSLNETEKCLVCGDAMQNIGWFEEATDRTEKMAQVVNEHLEKTSNADTGPHLHFETKLHKITTVEPENEGAADNEGGVNVAEERELVEETVVEGDFDNQPGKVTEGDADPVVNEELGVTKEEAEHLQTEDSDDDKAANVSEVKEDPDFEKVLRDLKATVEAGLATQGEAMAEVRKAIESIDSGFNTKVSELVAQYDELSKKFDALKSETDEVAKRLEAVDRGAAFKKSGDLGGSTESKTTANSGWWGGHFLGARDITS